MLICALLCLSFLLLHLEKYQVVPVCKGRSEGVNNLKQGIRATEGTSTPMSDWLHNCFVTGKFCERIGTQAVALGFRSLHCFFNVKGIQIILYGESKFDFVS